MKPWEVYLKDHEEQHLNEMIEFLRIPSISSLPEHADDVRRAGDWTADRLKSAGLEGVRVLETGGHPVVYGQWLHAPDKPTVMIYGHFDVQPVDPVHLWTDPPFEPVVRDDRVYARGASDDKGNVFAPILAVEAMLKSEGALPVNVKFLVEGQEEIGSPQLPDFIVANKELLACDLVLSADGGQWEEDQPALILGLRGLCGLQIDVRGARADVHSGTYGGTFQNPIHALARIIDSMRDADGKISVAGFYDDVRAISEEERTRIAKIPYDESDFKDELGVNALVGEPGYSTYERAWVRPTLDVNGIWGGFQGEGVKTVIAAEAHAKITCRLTPDQPPGKIVALITEHVKKHTPPGVEVAVHPVDSHADPYAIPHDHPGNQAVRTVFKELYGKEPFYARMGGSVPICTILHKTLGAYTVSFGFGLKDDNIHAPDEFFRLSGFDLGKRGYCMLLDQLARQEI
ncbi:MAG: dipeptidase [Desulfobacterales bacterium]|nr:dipeptidase [Desulfobacterales bacterium]